MHRLTEKDSQGNWCLKGMPWECLREGQAITREVGEKLYGALCKLKDYEDTELSPDRVERLNDFEKSQAGILLKKLGEERRKHQWIPVEEQLPGGEEYILISVDDFPIPAIGRYKEDETGGAFYVGDDEDSCLDLGLIVNAWMQLPERYKTGN